MPKEQVYDDGSEVVIVTEEDDPPKGPYVDSEEVIENMTGSELEAGEFLGAAIDPDDDEDDGSKWGTIENPTMRPEDFHD